MPKFYTQPWGSYEVQLLPRGTWANILRTLLLHHDFAYYRCGDINFDLSITVTSNAPLDKEIVFRWELLDKEGEPVNTDKPHVKRIQLASPLKSTLGKVAFITEPEGETASYGLPIPGFNFRKQYRNINAVDIGIILKPQTYRIRMSFVSDLQGDSGNMPMLVFTVVDQVSLYFTLLGIFIGALITWLITYFT
jgi:hypothetical protein